MDKIGSIKNKRKYAGLLLLIADVYVCLRFLSPLFSPFLFAFLFAGILDGLTKKIPLKIKKSAIAVIILILMVLALALLCFWLFSQLCQRGGEVVDLFSHCEESLCMLLGNCCKGLEKNFGIDGEAVEQYVLEQVNVFIENMEINILPSLMDKSVSCMKSFAGIAAFLAVFVIAVFLILKDYEKISGTLRENKELQGLIRLIKKIVSYFRTYVRAQLIILLIISGICALVLGILGIKGGIIYGLITGFMDMLPFIGTGIMLMPLAFVQLISKKYWKAAGILCLYAACALIREYTEPRLIGSRMGIWPVGILFSVFAGIKLFGIFGIIKGPVGMVVICEACKYLFEEKETKDEESG